MPGRGDQVVEPVDRAQEGGLAAPRRADDRGDRLALDGELQVAEHLARAVEEVEPAHVDGRRAPLGRCAAGGRGASVAFGVGTNEDLGFMIALIRTSP